MHALKRKPGWQTNRVIVKEKSEKLGLLRESPNFQRQASFKTAGGVFVKHFGLRGLVRSRGELAQAGSSGSSVTFFDSRQNFLAQCADAAFHGLIARGMSLRAADVFLGGTDVCHKKGVCGRGGAFKLESEGCQMRILLTNPQFF